jgi:hypothetical protein
VQDDEPDDAPWLACARVALFRGALVGGALVLPGLVVQACFSPVTAALLLGEAAFDLSIGAFVVAPVAFVERLALVRPHPPLERRVAVALAGALAFFGAVAAFLQSLYASAVLRTGSLDEGFGEVTRGAGLLVVLEDLLGLFACISLVVTTTMAGRTSGRATAALIARNVVAVIALAPLLLFVPGFGGPAVAISTTMLLSLGVLLPLLAPVADRLALRRRGGDDGR